MVSLLIRLASDKSIKNITKYGVYVVRLDDGYLRFFIFSLIFSCGFTHVITFNSYLIHSKRIIKKKFGISFYYIHRFAYFFFLWRYSRVSSDRKLQNLISIFVSG